MKQDEIIEMAVSNGFYKYDEGTITSPFIEDIDISELLLGFAEDIAAKEREAIAQLFEDAPALVPFAQNDQGGCLMCGFTPKMAVAAIRARGNNE